MRFIAFFVVLFFVCATSLQQLKENEYQFLFTKFVEQHSKSYEHYEFFERYNLFKDNLDMIREHNSQNHSYTLAMNEFGDLSFEEFKSQKYGYRHVQRPFLRSLNEVSATPKAYPTSVDWRTTNNPKKTVAVTPVQNQQQCGSCWAFSATAATEGAWALSGNTLTKLSEQQLVDCSSSFGNQGCNGGLMDQAFEYIIQSGQCTEASYPYQAVQGTCQTCTPVAKLTSFKDIPQGDETTMMAFAQNGPISVAIEADQQVFQFYSGGVFNNAACGNQLDHGVTVVGYGFDSSVNLPYWIVKNSWGNTWGEEGYIRIVRNQDMCGIADSASQPYYSS